jgi:hypothetical protein
MAAPKKTSLIYYTVDIGYERDSKLLAAKEIVDPYRKNPNLRFITPYIYQLMCAQVYASGYMLEWNEEKEIEFAANHELTIDTVQAFLGIFMKVGLFSQAMYDQHFVLTSSGIQTRWLDINKNILRRTGSIPPEFIVPKSNLPKKPGFSRKKPIALPKVIHTSTNKSTKQSSEKDGVFSEETGVFSEETGVFSEETGVFSEETKDESLYMKYQDNNNNMSIDNTILEKNSNNTNVVDVFKKVVSSEKTPVSSEKTPVSSEKTPVSSEKTPVSSEKTPVSSEKTPVSSEKTPVSSEKTPVISEISLMALLPIERCLVEFMNNPNCELSKMRFYQYGDFLHKDELAERWLQAYNRSLEISNTANKVLNDYCTHAFYWLKKQSLTQNPDDVNSKSKNDKQTGKSISLSDMAGKTKEELDEIYAYNPMDPNGTLTPKKGS